ncbi:hypothetical protein [Rhodococcus oxybenzonivorans]|uniref:hypothetical protein n=1 Tax=Rhodococcus oxybenzonivorans TaxID=1990687 RepID=UPI0013A58FF8|nr:hypothetical protein [Rhodococcus oxybenzonivorans]
MDSDPSESAPVGAPVAMAVRSTPPAPMTRLDIVALLKDPAEGTQTYSCGPERLLPR